MVYHTSVKLTDEHYKWVNTKGRGFNFSDWVRDRIDEEMKKDNA